MSSSVFDSNNLSAPLVPEHHQLSNGTSHQRSSFIEALPAPGKPNPRHLLQWLNIGSNANVSGYAVSGEVFAFLGSDEKTLILETLATEDRNQSMCAFLGLPEFSSEAAKQTKVNAEKILFNGQPHRSPAKEVAFLRYEYLQCLYNELTVLDYLQFTHRISHPSMSVSQVTSLLQLEALLPTPIGHLNDVQRYCVLLGQELLRDAQIFLLEDPLTSLDNDAAASLMQVLRCISRDANRLVLLSLSSFSNNTLNYIDRTQIISPEGCLYFGPTARLESYLSAAGYECSAKASVADLLNTLLTACKQANALEIEMRKISPVSSRLSSHQDLESMRQSEETVGARSTTGGLSDAGLSAQVSYVAFNADKENISALDAFLCFWRQVGWLLWRAFAVRVRNLDLLINTLFLGGVMVGLAVSFTFYNVKDDMNGFQNRCAFLSVYPFGVVLVCNMWFDSDLKDWKVFCYERKRSAYAPLLFPCANLIADTITLRIVPAIIATAIMYDMVGLNDDTDVRKTFYLTFILMIVTGTMLARFFCFLMTSCIYNMAPIKAAMQSAAIYCLLILYAGFLLNLDTLPPSKYFVRDWSFFYWGCNTLYYNEMSTLQITVADIAVNNSGFDQYIVAAVNVTDIDPICSITPDWCTFCRTGHSDHIIHPHYNCTLYIDVDICNPESHLINSTMCAHTNGTMASSEIKIPGTDLLPALAIPEIGQTKVYNVLFHQSAVYLACCLIFALLFHREWRSQRGKK